MLYAAYGSNLNIDAMARRCPKARPVGKAFIKGWRLIFRSVADISNKKGGDIKVPIGLWEITDECEAVLDRYEGVGNGLYRREWVDFTDGRRALVYIMNHKGIHPPTNFYLETIRQGYRDFRIPERYLDEAVDHSIRCKAPTPRLIAHHARRLAKERDAA